MASPSVPSVMSAPPRALGQVRSSSLNNVGPAPFKAQNKTRRQDQQGSTKENPSLSGRITIRVPADKQSGTKSVLVQLDPIMLLRRSQVPRWAVLHTSTTAMSALTANPVARLSPMTLAPCSFFRANLAQLACLDDPAGSLVLMARLLNLPEVTSPFCFVERVGDRVYGIVKLVNRVTVSTITEWAREPHRNALGRVSSPASRVGEWWRLASVDLSCRNGASSTTPSLFRSGRLHMGVFNGRPSLGPCHVDSGESQLPGALSHQDQLVADYLHAVYLSRSSLALFAKGPLGKARREFCTDFKPLASLLRRVVMTSKQMDCKYGDTIPTLAQAGKPKCRRSTKTGEKKEVKRRKDGLLEKEDELAIRWWTGWQDRQMNQGDEDGDAAEFDGHSTSSSRMTRAITELRTREALAQVILMMEILILESEIDKTADLAGSNGAAVGDGTEEGGRAKKTKRERKVDVDLALDLLADRLCIWLSVEDSISAALTVAGPGGSTAGGKNNGGSSDLLRDFCTDVILPFYMVRLPSIAGSIARKFGWTSSPVKLIRTVSKMDKVARSRSQTQQPNGRTGTDMTGRKSRNRIGMLTERSFSQQHPPTHSRSSASPAPNVTGQRTLSRASSVVSSSSTVSRFKAREVDLDAMSAITAARIERKKRVDAELRDSRSGSSLSRTISCNDGIEKASSPNLTTTTSGRLQRHHSMVNPLKRPAQSTHVVVQATPTKRARTMIPINIQSESPFLSHHSNPSDFQPTNPIAISSTFEDTPYVREIGDTPIRKPGLEIESVHSVPRSSDSFQYPSGDEIGNRSDIDPRSIGMDEDMVMDTPSMGPTLQIRRQVRFENVKPVKFGLAHVHPDPDVGKVRNTKSGIEHAVEHSNRNLEIDGDVKEDRLEVARKRESENVDDDIYHQLGWV